MSNKFYSVVKSISNTLLDISEPALKQWLGTVIGQRFLKWFTDIIIKRFFIEIAEPIMRVGVIRVGYYYDVNEAKDKIKKLKNAEDANNEELYIATLNDIRRK